MNNRAIAMLQTLSALADELVQALVKIQQQEQMIAVLEARLAEQEKPDASPQE